MNNSACASNDKRPYRMKEVAAKEAFPVEHHVPGVLMSLRPIGRVLPLVLDSPHSGNDYPADFDHVPPRDMLRRAEDAFVDELFETAPAHGASFLKALFPRSYIDPNRHEHEVDLTMLGEPWPHPVIEKSAGKTVHRPGAGGR